MSETARSALQRIPSLVSLSTLAMASDFSYECPSGMFSLLCAVTGSCSLAAADRSIHLVGSRMALLSGSISYRMKDASPDLAVTRALQSAGALVFLFLGITVVHIYRSSAAAAIVPAFIGLALPVLPLADHQRHSTHVPLVSYINVSDTFPFTC